MFLPGVAAVLSPLRCAERCARAQTLTYTYTLKHTRMHTLPDTQMYTLTYTHEFACVCTSAHTHSHARSYNIMCNGHRQARSTQYSVTAAASTGLPEPLHTCTQTHTPAHTLTDTHTCTRTHTLNHRLTREGHLSVGVGRGSSPAMESGGPRTLHTSVPPLAPSRISRG